MDPPKVTGLSPLEGPPGTKITIRGENLGVSQKDLAYLSICGVDCTMYAEWISPSKILARTRSGMDKGDVIVTTLSGGEGTCTVKLRGFQEPVDSSEEACDIFEDVLARKDKADSMRNALSVLQRFRFLFNLPANLEKNIQQGDYDIVINAYARAKFLFKDTQVVVFKKVYQEVEQRIDKFRILLSEKLKTFPCHFDEQKKLVKHLVNLEAPGNPAWDCVSNTHVWLNNIMNNCKDNHLTQSTSFTQCYATLLKLDLPEEVLSKFQQLLFDFRVHSMSGLFSHATEEVRNLHTRETWLIEMDDKNGGTTQLPLLFENRVVETLQLVRENVFSQFHMQANIKQLSQSLLHSFAEALSKLAHPENTESPVNGTNQNINLSNQESINNFNKDEKILIVLSNCNFSRKSVVPRLTDSFQKHGYPDMSLVIKGAQSKYRDLEKELFETYQTIKCDPLVGAMETRMYAGKFDWYNCAKPTGVSVYIKHTIMSMIAVHAEVVSLTPPSMPQVMTKVVETAVEEITRLYECVRKFGRYGNVQATLDIRAFEETISAFSTNVTSKNFMVCRSKLEPFVDIKDRELVEHLLNQFRNNMRLQLLCFKEDSVVTV